MVRVYVAVILARCVARGNAAKTPCVQQPPLPASVAVQVVHDRLNFSDVLWWIRG